jgi:TRAP-type C4-dicarboxylate transport system permease large subunit
MIVILAMGLGLFAPPFGLCCYAAGIIGGVAPEARMRRIWIYLGALSLGLLVLTLVPWFSIRLL